MVKEKLNKIIEKKIKELSKNIYKLRKLIKKDSTKAVIYAKELIESINEILKSKHLKDKFETRINLKKVKSNLELYIKQIKLIEEFNKK